jgi:sigma-B regulation protein RsbU (phosphoserine phosphatase)
MSDAQFMDLLMAEAEQINLAVRSIQEIPEDISDILGLQKISLKEIMIIQNTILENFPELYGMAIAFEPYQYLNDVEYFSQYQYWKNGKLIKTTLNDPVYDYFTQNWYLLPKLLGKPVWTTPAYDEGGGEAFMTTYAVPFNSLDKGQEVFSGVVTIDVSIDWLVDHFSRNNRLPQNGIVMLISDDGTILSTRTEKWVINETIFSLSEALEIPELRSIGRAIHKGEFGSRKIFSTHFNTQVMIYYSVIKANNWGLLFLIPEDGVELSAAK